MVLKKCLSKSRSEYLTIYQDMDLVSCVSGIKSPCDSFAELGKDNSLKEFVADVGGYGARNKLPEGFQQEPAPKRRRTIPAHIRDSSNYLHGSVVQ